MLTRHLAKLRGDAGGLFPSLLVLLALMVDVASLGQDAQLPRDEKGHDAERQHGDDQEIGDAVEEIGYYGLIHGYHNPPLSNQLDLISTPLE